jgi:glycerol uptake facilitator-like aquaporin
MDARFFGEFMGTAMLILLGDGVVANVLLKRSMRQPRCSHQPRFYAWHGHLFGRLL